MTLSVKNKIWLGTLFLFGLLLLTGGVGIFSTAQLKSEAKAVLKDNYESLSYAQEMQARLDAFSGNQATDFHAFDSALRLQEQNVTEPGERRPTQDLRTAFVRLRKGKISGKKDSADWIRQARSNLNKIVVANMDAISVKNSHAEKVAGNALVYLSALTGVVFLIALSFSVNFPSVVTSPISQFLEAIKAISAKNYGHRIHLERKDEYGQMAAAFNEMAERLQQYANSNLAKLLFEKARAEAVINSLQDAGIGINEDGRVLFANQQALQLLHLKPEAVVGKPVEEISVRNDLFRFLMAHDSPAPFKIVVDGKENYFVKESMEVRQEAGQSKVFLIRNITSFKELDVAKTNFIATISHELKTPLAASDFSLKLLQDARTGTLNPEQEELLRNIKEDHQRMLRILSELLNMSQVEAGRIELQRQRVAPIRIVESALDTVASAARERSIVIQSQVAPSLPETEVDAEKTTWVLNNFLTNAIKYSQTGSDILVRVTQAGEVLLFSVQDSGPGIAREHQQRLFERYFQAPGSRIKGFGLGLSISKDFIEAQGGRIWVESEEGQGATFYFSLPIA